MLTIELLTISDAAMLLNVSVSTVRRLIDRGELPCIRVAPHCLRIETAALDAFVDMRRSNSPAAVAATSRSEFARASAAYQAAVRTMHASKGRKARVVRLPVR